MNNPTIYLKSLSYEIGINYPNLGLYVGLFNSEYLLFINNFATYKQDIDIHNIAILPSLIELEHIISKIDYFRDLTIPMNCHNMLVSLNWLNIHKFTVIDVSVSGLSEFALVTRIYE